MKKIFSTLCGICATAFIASTIITVSSCSQDDDYYESDMYTMAEPLETRAAEPGTGEPLMIAAGSDTIYRNDILSEPTEVIFTWPQGSFGTGHPTFSVSIFVKTLDGLYGFSEWGDLRYEIYDIQTSWVGGSQFKATIRVHTKTISSNEIISTHQVEFTQIFNFKYLNQ